MQIQKKEKGIQKLALKCLAFREASKLIEFVEENSLPIPMTEKEAEVLLHCLDGHGCMVGHWGTEIVCLDLRPGERTRVWKPYTMDDAIAEACDYNYKLIVEKEQALAGANDQKEYKLIKEWLENLQMEAIKAGREKSSHEPVVSGRDAGKVW